LSFSLACAEGITVSVEVGELNVMSLEEMVGRLERSFGTPR
jgi:hypothetical protein